MRRLRAALLLLLLLFPNPEAATQSVSQTVHNLSTSGPGTFKSSTVTEVCVFCHTPHTASPGAPLWNRELSGATYVEYGSSTLKASPGQPTGTSRLCLSCHDGTVALGALLNPPSGVQTDLADSFLTGRANLGTDLSDDHPVSFAYDSSLVAVNPELEDPAQINLPLQQDDLQCSTCHDPHSNDLAPFLRKTTLNGALCTTCHNIGGSGHPWSTSVHAVSAAGPGAVGNPWSERKAAWRGQTVAENACFNCHMPHNAVTPPRLIKDREEEACFLCHDGGVAKSDIRTEVGKIYRHPVDLFFGVHDPSEQFGIQPPNDHVECADCHNPHAITDVATVPPDVPGSLFGVSGVDNSGAPVTESRFLYEVCYKCHGDNSVLSQAIVSRQILELNTLNEFDPANPSFHPIEGIGQNSNVPSLIPPLSETSIITCTDCHNNDSSTAVGGIGPDGPHGSIFEGLLERNYSTADNTPESPLAYDLCYKCHDRASILANESFSKHREHIVDENAPCSACHDSHGVSAIQGNFTNNSHLINFDVTIVSPNSLGFGPVFEDLGLFTGQCSLSCHGEDHDGLRY